MLKDYWSAVDEANDLRRFDEFEEYMSKAQFTPGPWRRDGECITAGTDHVVCFGHDYDDGGIYAREQLELEKYRTECEANARLIAAAPRMYAFIQFCAAAGNAEAKAILEEIG